MTLEIIQNIYDEWALDALENIESKRKSWLSSKKRANLFLFPAIILLWLLVPLTFWLKIILIAVYVVLVPRALFARAYRLKDNYLNYLNEFKTRIVETFVGVIIPDAKDINFYPTEGISQEEFLGLEVFSEVSDYGESNKYYRYSSENLLTFQLNGLVHRLANVTAPVFSRGKSIHVFSGMFYDFSFPLQKDNNLTIMLPKRLGTDWVTLEQEYDKESKELVIKRIGSSSWTPHPLGQFGGFLGSSSQVYYNYKPMENLSMENEEIEDNFYVFSYDENSTRKLLSYRFMETLANVFLSPNRSMSSYWLVFKNKKLRMLEQKIYSSYFNYEGENSTTIENLEENFYRLARDLSCLFKLDLV